MTTPNRTIAVHVLGEDRTHLAPPHLGRLAQGRLKTLCGKLAVGELSPFEMLKTGRRCPDCFRAAKEAGIIEAEPATPAPKRRK